RLRTGYSHPYATRRFYLDEDSWSILAADLYDARGELVGLQESHPISYYEVPMFNSTLETLYHLKTGNYFVDGLDNNEPMYDFDYPMSPQDFTPQALRRAVLLRRQAHGRHALEVTIDPLDQIADGGLVALQGVHLDQPQMVEAQHLHRRRVLLGHSGFHLMQHVGDLHQLALEAQAIDG